MCQCFALPSLKLKWVAKLSERRQRAIFGNMSKAFRHLTVVCQGEAEKKKMCRSNAIKHESLSQCRISDFQEA